MDEKGRLFVPAKLRGELGETFFVTIGTNGGRRCLTVYTQAGWESLCARYDALPLSQKFGPMGSIWTAPWEAQAIPAELPNVSPRGVSLEWTGMRLHFAPPGSGWRHT